MPFPPQQALEGFFSPPPCWRMKAGIITMCAVVVGGVRAFKAVQLPAALRPGKMVNTTTASNRRFADPANAANFTDAAVPAGAAATFEEACTKPCTKETCEYDTSGPVVHPT